jgi:protein associated with RNAse G/E
MLRRVPDLASLYAPGDVVRLEFRKWDDRLHYWWDALVIEVRETAVLVGMSAGCVFHHVTRGFDLVLEHDGRLAFWPDRWYSGGPDLEPGSERVLEYYFNIGTPPQLAPGLITVVDLEVDVKVRPDHRMERFDLDEFEEAAARYGYPAWLRRQITASLTELDRLIEEGRWPLLPPQSDHDRDWLARGPTQR